MKQKGALLMMIFSAIFVGVGGLIFLASKYGTLSFNSPMIITSWTLMGVGFIGLCVANVIYCKYDDSR